MYLDPVFRLPETFPAATHLKGWPEGTNSSIRRTVGDFDARVDALKQRSLDATATFVMAEVELGLTFCKLANSREDGREQFAHRIENARKALTTAEKYMWNLRMDHAVFNRMTALAERLRFELDNLTGR
jgi:hypothetical protein